MKIRAEVKIIKTRTEVIETLKKIIMFPKPNHENISYILNYSHHYSNDLEIQRFVCHAIGNLALDLEMAKRIMILGGWDVIQEAIVKYGKKDRELCLKSLSSFWNLARPIETSHFTVPGSVDIIVEILRRNVHDVDILECIFGSLGNLVVSTRQYTISKLSGELNNLFRIIADCNSKNLMTANLACQFFTFLSNFAIGEDEARYILTHQQVLNIGIDTTSILLAKYSYENMKNTIKSISALWLNLCEFSNFVEHCVACNGITFLLFLHDISEHDQDTRRFLDDILRVLNLNKKEDISTLHFSVNRNFNHLTHDLLISIQPQIDVRNGYGHTPLHMAIINQNKFSVQLLICCGAKIDKYALRLLTILSIQEEFYPIIERSRKIFSQIQKKLLNSIIGSSNFLNTDVATISLSFLHGVEIYNFFPLNLKINHPTYC